MIIFEKKDSAVNPVKRANKEFQFQVREDLMVNRAYPELEERKVSVVIKVHPVHLFAWKMSIETSQVFLVKRVNIYLLIA